MVCILSSPLCRSDTLSFFLTDFYIFKRGLFLQLILGFSCRSKSRTQIVLEPTVDSRGSKIILKTDLESFEASTNYSRYSVKNNNMMLGWCAYFGQFAIFGLQRCGACCVSIKMFYEKYTQQLRTPTTRPVYSSAGLHPAPLKPSPLSV